MVRNAIAVPLAILVTLANRLTATRLPLRWNASTAENHLVLPGRFRAHAGAPARSGPNSSAHGNEHAESSSNQRPGFAQAASSYRTAFPSYNATGAGARAARGGGPQAVSPSAKYEGAQLNARRGGAGSSSNPVTPTRRRNRRLSSQRAPGSAGAGGGGGALSERAWLLRPTRDRVETWLDAWYKRWLVLVIVPSCIVSWNGTCTFRDVRPTGRHSAQR